MTGVEESDLEEAAACVRRGETTAFAKIVDGSGDFLFRAATRLMGRADEARDLVQECYLRAFQALREGRYTRSVGLRAWLYRIVAHAALDALRTRKRRQPVHAGGALPTPHDGSTDARLALGEIAGFIDALPAQQRVALILSAVEGLSTREVAQAMHCSEGSVEQRLVRARDTLRRRMDEQPH